MDIVQGTLEKLSLAVQEQPPSPVESGLTSQHDLRALFELVRDLGNSLSLDETLALLAKRLLSMISWESMALYVLKGDVLFPEYVTGDEFRLFSSLEIPLGKGLSGWVASTRNAILNGDPSMELGYMKGHTQFANLRSALVVPLEGQSGVIGVLSLYRSAREAFTQNHLRTLLAIQSKVALSVENALRFQQAEALSTTDNLTALPNARSLFLHLDGELARARRTKTPVALFVGDVDGFKEVNDRFGQTQGNTFLRWVAKDLKAACREYDFVARMGGDEFVLVLPGLTPENVAARCARFREVVANAGRQVYGSGTFGMSIGQVFFPADGNDAEELLAEANRRMFLKKQESRLRRAQMAMR